jgi:hypothetical protein
MARTHHILTVLLLSSAPVAASPTAPPDSAVDKRLIDLRAELWEAGRAKAATQLGKFRALCDNDGYPLVGNVASKSDLYQPSELCSVVRKAEKQRGQGSQGGGRG